jgi:flagellar biosynthesis protein FlhA
MKNSEKFSLVTMATGLFVLFLNAAFVFHPLFDILIDIFTNYNFPNGYFVIIILITSLAIISSLQLCLNHGWTTLVREVSARFILDGSWVKQIEIEVELNIGEITEEEANNKKHELQKEKDFAGLIGVCSNFFSTVNIMITIGIISIVILFLIIDKTGIFTINNKYMMAILVYGIISQIILTLILIFSYIFRIKIVKKEA